MKKESCVTVMQDSFSFVRLSYCKMEATLLDLVLDVASPFLPLVAQHFGKHPLQSIIADRLADCPITVVADVYGGTKEMT